MPPSGSWRHWAPACMDVVQHRQEAEAPVCPEETDLLSMLTCPGVVQKSKSWKILRRPSSCPLHQEPSSSTEFSPPAEHSGAPKVRVGLGATCWPVGKCRPQPLSSVEALLPAGRPAESTQFGNSNWNGAPSPKQATNWGCHIASSIFRQWLWRNRSSSHKDVRLIALGRVHMYFSGTEIILGATLSWVLGMSWALSSRRRLPRQAPQAEPEEPGSWQHGQSPV